MKRILIFAALTLVAACSGSPRTTGDLGTARDLSSALADLLSSPSHDLAQSAAADLAQASAYPAGPYGNTVGATIPPLVWEGYSDPLADAIATSKTYGAYSMNDLRMSGRPYAAVHVAEFF